MYRQHTVNICVYLCVCVRVCVCVIMCSVAVLLMCLYREERTGNTLYQEIHFQEPDALAEMDEGADITGETVLIRLYSIHFPLLNTTLLHLIQHFYT